MGRKGLGVKAPANCRLIGRWRIGSDRQLRVVDRERKRRQTGERQGLGRPVESGTAPPVALASKGARRVRAMAPKSWLAEWFELTGHVEELFADAKARRLQVPPRDACASVANMLMVVRDRAVAAPLRKDNTRGARNGARKSAKAFLRHLRPLRQNLAAQIAEIREIEMLGDLAPPMLASNLAAHEQLEAAARAVEALLPVLETPPTAPWPDHDPIRFIAGQAQKAWADANDGTSPHSKNPGDPLVKFVSKALSLVGMSLSPHTVSAVLRGLRRTERVDKIRN
jgi:hypothetical protein